VRHASDRLASGRIEKNLTTSHVHALAACLFDLRAAQEVEMCALTSVQRSLERVRCPDACGGESDLLWGEMARLIDQAAETSATVARHRARAAELIRLTRAELAAGSHAPDARLDADAPQPPTPAIQTTVDVAVRWDQSGYVAVGDGV